MVVQLIDAIEEHGDKEVGVVMSQQDTERMGVTRDAEVVAECDLITVYGADAECEESSEKESPTDELFAMG